MKAFQILPLIFPILISINIYGQSIPKNTKFKNYCPNQKCTLKPTDPAHFDPYYNHHLCENFNPDQIDFSKEYLQLQSRFYTKNANLLKQSLKNDFSNIWVSSNSEQNGVLGEKYQRIQVHIDKVSKSDSQGKYWVIGKTKVMDNVCDFKGSIFITNLTMHDYRNNTAHKKRGKLLTKYLFYEDSTQYHTGIFAGVTECSFYLDSTGKHMQVDESAIQADGYWNRTFVGTWTQYKTTKAMKCIWGDYRLPFTFDFDCGDGEMMVCEKYKLNGWQKFGDGSEYIKGANGQMEIKDKWWLRK